MQIYSACVCSGCSSFLALLFEPDEEKQSREANLYVMLFVGAFPRLPSFFFGFFCPCPYGSRGKQNKRNEYEDNVARASTPFCFGTHLKNRSTM